MSDTAEQIESLLRDIHYNLIRRTRPVLHERGLTPPRFHALSHVSTHGSIDMSEIRRRLHVSKSTATAVIDGLVQEGLLERHRPENDRRRVIIQTTEAGRSVLEAMRLHKVDLVRTALEGTGATRQGALVKALEHMKAQLERKE